MAIAYPIKESKGLDIDVSKLLENEYLEKYIFTQNIAFWYN
jgi:hypothetical protein